jgi:Fur family ferric uptake transcriptional regulator
MEETSHHSEQLRLHGQKITKQRLGILAVLETADTPLTAQDIHLRLNLEQFPISLSTVYRNLDRLLAEELIVKQGFYNDKCQYAIKRSEHFHSLICLACRKVVTIEECPLEQFSRDLGRREGFQITEHHMELYGYCPECVRKEGIASHAPKAT